MNTTSGRRVAIFVALAASLYSSTALAHHSFAMFDSTKEVTVTGTLGAVSWTSPHIWFDLMVPDGKGGVVKWGIEADSPATLTRGGWKYGEVKVGEKYTFVLRPQKNGKPGGALVSATMPNGRVVGRGNTSGLESGKPRRTESD